MFSVTGIILAGGYSRRMGSDKALLELGGQPVIARIATELAEITDNVLIACGEQEREEYSFLQYPLVLDRYPGYGPLAGLHAAVSCSTTAWSLVVACDLPFASANFMRQLTGELEHNEQQFAEGVRDQASGISIDMPMKDVHALLAVSASGRVQPLLGLYHKDVLPSLEEALRSHRLRVMDWLETLNVQYVSEIHESGNSDINYTLLNMNTPVDYYNVVIRMANRYV